MLPTRLFAAILVAALALIVPAHAAGRFFAPAQESASANIAADPQGGLHAAFTGYDGETGDLVYYRHCAADCENPARWQMAELPVTDPILVQIATTPEGQPRLLITSTTTAGAGASNLYLYGECNADCTTPRNWTIVPIGNSAPRTFSGLFQFRVSEHSFAIDDRGRPYFIYVDANYGAEPDHYGSFLNSCEADCTDPENWLEANLAVRLPERYTTELWDQVALAVARGGKLRLLAKVYALDDAGDQIEGGEGLYYYQCDSGCGDRANWQRTKIIDTGYGSYPNPGWDIEVLPDGRPRVAFFAGSDMAQESLDHQLLYLWCDSGCDSEANWYGHAVTATGDGEAPDLALTAAGAPRIAFLGAYGDLGFLSCDSDCESDTGNWQLRLQEATGDAAEDRPTALPFTCDAELWNGFLPRLALAGDKPWLAYDLVVEARCLYQEYGDPLVTYEFHELWRGARLSWGDGLVVPPAGAVKTAPGALPSR